MKHIFPLDNDKAPHYNNSMNTKSTKNECAKTRPQDDPYEVWRDGSDWEWRVLKKYQANDDKEWARWFCAVKSPYTYGGYELGDVYVAEIKNNALRVK